MGQARVFGLNDGDVGPGVGPDDMAADFAPVVQANTQPARAADDVVIGEQKAVGRDQEAGPRSGRSGGCRQRSTARRFTTAGPSFSATVTITRE